MLSLYILNVDLLRVKSIILFLVLVGPLGVTYLWLNYQKKQVKREIKWSIIHGIDREELTVLKFGQEEASQLKWKHSKEFEFKGDMYDIVDSEVHGDSIIYWCWWDHKETKLNKQLTQLVSLSLKGNSQNQNQKWHIQYIIKTLYFNIKSSPINSVVASSDKANTRYCFAIKQYQGSLLSPPPQLS